MSTVDYTQYMHLLTLIETHARTARESMACAVDLQNNPPRPTLSLAGGPPPPSAAEIAGMAQNFQGQSMHCANKALESAARLSASLHPVKKPEPMETANIGDN